MDKVDSVGGVERPSKRPLRISFFEFCDLLLSFGQSGQCGRRGEALRETYKIFYFGGMLLSCGQSGQCGCHGQTSRETSKILEVCDMVWVLLFMFELICN